MPLEPLQQDIAQILKSRRSTKSFVGGSSVFNEHFPRISDDIDIYAEDVEVTKIADLDVQALRDAGLHVLVNNQFYGFVVEAIVTRTPNDLRGTKLEWTEPDRRRFYPIQPNKTFGWTLHKTDLAIQKLIAAASRRKPRDALDIVLLDSKYARLAALAIAAPAKLETASPIAILERALQHAIEHPMDDYRALRIDHAAMPFPIEQVKTIVADKINAAITEITQRCTSAEPGFIYLPSKAGAPIVPTDDTIHGLTKHGITAKGTVPIFSQVSRAKSGTDIGDR